jgi:nucleoside-diphosphate-sugar epimerase
MTHVLVTGGAGYLGSILCERLLEGGCRVTALDNLLYGQQSLFHLCSRPGFDFIRGDVRDESLMETCLRDADVIVPLAAIVGAPACDRDPWLATAINLESIRLLNRLRSPEQLVIFPTTNSGYGESTGEAYCTEETPLTPISLYGRTKAEAEAEILGRPNAIALRLATVFGMSPRMRLDLLVNHFVHCAVTQGYLVLFEATFKRNFIHIRDVADCIAHCIEKESEMVGRTYNVGLDSANLSKQQLAEKIREHVPGLQIQHAPVGSDPDRRNYVVSSGRLRAAGYQARRSLDEGIRELLVGYRLISGPGAYRNA